MKTSVQILGRKLREQWVEVLVEEGSEDSEVVRLKFAELPDTEFEALEAQFRGRLIATGRLLKETDELEEKYRAELPPDEKGKALAYAQRDKVKEFKGSLDALKEIRREVVSKVVIGHRPDDFQLTDLPMSEEKDLWAQLAPQLLEYGFTQDQLDQGALTGYLDVPFMFAEWDYERGSEVIKKKGAGESTIRFYEKSRSGGALLNSICNAVLKWHKLELKSAAQVKAALADARLAKRQQLVRISNLLAQGFVKQDRGEFLKSLPSHIFETVVAMLLENSKEILIKLNGQEVPPVGQGSPQKG